jgi:hypothetical protein
LSQRIQQLISDFQRQYPMTPAEIRQALLHAASSAGGSRRPLAVIIAAGVVAALGAGLFVSRSGGGGGEVGGMPILAAVGVAAAVAGLVLAIRRSR